MVSPMCWGPPHDACAEMDIPIIFVERNRTNAETGPKEGEHIQVNTYLEAAGALIALRQGIHPTSPGI